MSATPEPTTVEWLAAARAEPESALFMLELALEAKAQRLELSAVELAVLAVCTFKREVEAGGYEAFLTNASRQHAGRIVDALMRIGCTRHAAITARALAAVQPPSSMSGPSCHEDRDELAQRRALAACDTQLDACDEDCVDTLLSWLAGEADAFSLP